MRWQLLKRHEARVILANTHLCCCLVIIYLLRVRMHLFLRLHTHGIVSLIWGLWDRVLAWVSGAIRLLP
jgi:hypothetical protein